MKQRLLLIGSIIAILGSAYWVYLRLTVPSKAVVQTHRAVGRMLALETQRVLGDRGSVVLITPDLRKQPLLKFETDAYKDTLQHDTKVTVQATEVITAAETARSGAQSGFAPQRFLNVVESYPQAGAIVSFAGLPYLSDKDIEKLPRPLPRLLATSRMRKDVRGQLDSHLLQVVILPRFNFPAPIKGNPDSLDESFNKYYEIVTKSSQLPAETSADKRTKKKTH